VPGSPTTPGRPSARVVALGHIAFRYTDSVGTRDQFSIAAQWLARTFPCRRFADILADAGDRFRQLRLCLRALSTGAQRDRRVGWFSWLADPPFSWGK
jgi:hypothetical protein